jgi:DNA-binding beta-propeller fold protein YncE
VLKITPAGAMSNFAYCTEPLGIAFDPVDQVLYAGDYTGHRVCKVTLAGNVSTFASGVGTPYGVTLDPNRNVYAMDYSGGNIYRVTPAGAVGTFVTGLGNPMFAAFLPEPATALSILTLSMLALLRHPRSASRKAPASGRGPRSAEFRQRRRGVYMAPVFG